MTLYRGLQSLLPTIVNLFLKAEEDESESDDQSVASAAEEEDEEEDDSDQSVDEEDDDMEIDEVFDEDEDEVDTEEEEGPVRVPAHLTHPASINMRDYNRSPHGGRMTKHEADNLWYKTYDKTLPSHRLRCHLDEGHETPLGSTADAILRPSFGMDTEMSLSSSIEEYPTTD